MILRRSGLVRRCLGRGLIGVSVGNWVYCLEFLSSKNLLVVGFN